MTARSPNRACQVSPRRLGRVMAEYPHGQKTNINISSVVLHQPEREQKHVEFRMSWKLETCTE